MESPSPTPEITSLPPSRITDPSASTAEGTFKITINFTPEHFSEPWTFTTAPVLDELITECAQTWPQYDWTKCKAILSSKKPPNFTKSLLKTPEDDELDLIPLNNATLKLMAPKTSDLQTLQQTAKAAADLRASRSQQRTIARLRAMRINARPLPGNPRISGFSSSSSQPSAQYTFHKIEPLPYLPNPQRSLSFLQRLATDPGIVHAMKTHQFSVGLLTEMDPSQNTQSDHQGTMRILGLNRNKGQVIELRLRTDAYDGYRDYKTIRKTLCHELAHNVHSDHDRDFWDLTHQIEREVARADYRSHGRSLGDEEYAPVRDYEEDEEEFMDHGGWTGGTFVLGGSTSAGTDIGGGSTASASGSGSGNDNAAQDAGLTRREIMARAAERRLRNLSSSGPDQGKEKEGGGSESSRDGPSAT